MNALIRYSPEVDLLSTITILARGSCNETYLEVEFRAGIPLWIPRLAMAINAASVKPFATAIRANERILLP